MFNDCVESTLNSAICLGRPLHSEKSKSSSKNSAPEKSQGRQYVSQSQQTQGVAGNPQTYGQYPPSYAGAVQNQYGQQQYDQQPQQQQQQMAGQSPNKGHTGALYSYRPVVDHDSKYTIEMS